jgi:threonine dehydratase
MNIFHLVQEAAVRIQPYIRQTPLEFSAYLSHLCECHVYLKLENLQVTGSFKARGGLNKVLSLSEQEKHQGVVTASTGNHAAAVALALQQTTVSGVIYMPENVAPNKVENLKQYADVELRFAGQDSVESEAAALAEAKKTGKIFISPYNDPQVIGGQGTIGLELLKQIPDMQAVLVPVGGGGLISGIAGCLKHKHPEIEVVGCQPENSAVMYHSIQAGEILDLESRPTISDGTAGGIEQGSITFEICRHQVDGYHLVTEDEIKNALFIMMQHHQMMVEGAAGLSIAALIKNKDRYKGKKVVLIICGNKMSMGLLKEVLDASQV